MSQTNRKRKEIILREPLTRQRFLLTQKIQAAQGGDTPFTLEELQKIFTDIGNVDPSARQEATNVLEALRTGKAPMAPQVQTPGQQLLWGAAIGYLESQPDRQTPVTDVPFWKQLCETKSVFLTLIGYGYDTREVLRGNDIGYRWGTPGSGLMYSREKNTVDFDLRQALIQGFEHARADIYRELGYAVLSLSYPMRMRALAQEMQPLVKKAAAAKAKKGPELKPAEYKKLRLLGAEWQLRQMMFDAAESNAANRFVINMGKAQQSQQDYGVSLNNTAVTSRAIGLTRLPPEDKENADLRRYMNLCNAVQLSFYQNNSFFNDDEWERQGVEPGLVRRTDTRRTQPEDNAGADHPDFKMLRELCGGKNGLEHLQPRPNERLQGRLTVLARAQAADAERKKVIEKIWELYAEDLIKNLLKQTNDDVDQELEQQQQQEQQQPQDGEGEGQEQDGEQQPGQGGGKGKPKNDKKKKKGGGRGQQQGDAQDDTDGEGDAEGEDQEQGEEQGEEQSGKSKLGTDKDETAPVEGKGDMPSPSLPNEKPGDEMDPSAQEQGEEADQNGPGEGDGDGDGDGHKQLAQLEKELAEKEAAEAAAQGQGKGKDGKPQDKEDKPAQGAGSGKGKPLADLAQLPWDDYPKRVAELSPQIAQVRRRLFDIQRRQTQPHHDIGGKRDFFPKGGNLKKRFDLPTARKRVQGEETGTQELDHYRPWKKDETTRKPATIDLVIWIDGSSSMGNAMGNTASPLQTSLQTAAMFYEAANAKGLSVNVWIGMAGDKAPTFVVRPGDDLTRVGQGFESMRPGLRSGTEFSPIPRATAEELSFFHDRKSDISALTHILLISDGDVDHGDKEKTQAAFEALMETNERVTLDVAIIADPTKPKTAIQDVAEKIQPRRAHQKIGFFVGNDLNKVPMGIADLILDKVLSCGRAAQAVPNSKKRRAMRNALSRMDQKP